jgi:hypothetical protein
LKFSNYKITAFVYAMGSLVCLLRKAVQFRTQVDVFLFFFFAGSGRLPLLAATCRVVRPFVLVDSARIAYTIFLLIRTEKSATVSFA